MRCCPLPRGTGWHSSTTCGARAAAAPQAPDYETEQARVTALLRQWSAEKDTPEDDSPEKLLYPLEHAYTSAELAFETLKGADAAVAAVLVAAASGRRLRPPPGAGRNRGKWQRRTHRVLWVAPPGRWSYDEDAEDAEDFEVIEVHDRSETLSEWRRPDGSQPALGTLPFLEEELCPPEVFADLEPDEQHFHEATGNEGASFERTYRRAALVLWPHARQLAVLNQAGLVASLPYLGELTGRWAASGADLTSPCGMRRTNSRVTCCARGLGRPAGIPDGGRCPVMPPPY